ncbi:CBS domain-containing protein [Methanocella sp. CWC-04]|uniref:CBS domain-containing protein n=1 Tax=Methanooceanicella nereidis TaxID=2052831 RepID=A0AAP2W6M9_9EURY|nr:CBS domain-containing protein [Methanocella sp. CWC-04]MCD1294434.1 CBS domain-containing protein [Methanocella sp. CWC-04]
MTREGINEFGKNRRSRRANTGKFVHDLNESFTKGPLDFKQRISQHVSGIMAVASKDVVTIPPTTTIMGAARTMVGYGYRRLPVADPGTKRIEGICTVVDVIDFLGGGDKRQIIDKKYDGNMIVAINGPITEIMQQEVITIQDSSSLEDAVSTMIERSIGGAPVVTEDGKIVGIITERDIVHLMGETISGKRISDVMSERVTTAPPDMSIESAAKTMIESGFRRLPIVSNNLVCGIVTATDIMRYLGSGDAFKKLVTGNVDEALSLPVSSIMKGEIITVRPDEDLGATAKLMYRNKIGCLPVISDEGLAGIITEHDIMMSLKEEE